MSRVRALLDGLPEPDGETLEMLRRGREPSPISPADYLAFLQVQAPPKGGELGRRPILDGQPFRLTPTEGRR